MTKLSINEVRTLLNNKCNELNLNNVDELEEYLSESILDPSDIEDITSLIETYSKSVFGFSVTEHMNSYYIISVSSLVHNKKITVKIKEKDIINLRKHNLALGDEGKVLYLDDNKVEILSTN
jgi:hypothetical protein